MWTKLIKFNIKLLIKKERTCLLRRYVLNTGHWALGSIIISNITIILHKLTKFQNGYKNMIALRLVRLYEIHI